MDIKELQKKSDEIVNESDRFYNGKHNAQSTFIHMIEELGEIGEEINKPQNRNQEFDKKRFESELADLVMLISKLASFYNIDLEEAVEKKLNELNERYKS